MVWEYTGFFSQARHSLQPWALSKPPTTDVLNLGLSAVTGCDSHSEGKFKSFPGFILHRLLNKRS
jgi:hypothetical protein